MKGGAGQARVVPDAEGQASDSSSLSYATKRALVSSSEPDFPSVPPALPIISFRAT
jgi:hypothetical protein